MRYLPVASVMMGVPTYYTRLLGEADFSAATCDNLRLFISGSAPLLENTHREFKARSGHTILERYGMTETGMLTSNPLRGERRAGTVGLPLPGVQLRIVDANKNSLAAAVVCDANSEVDADTIIATAKQSLAAYNIPKRVEFVDQLPRNTMGKVQKSVLRERFAS